MHILFFQKGFDNFEIKHKTCQFLVRGAVPPQVNLFNPRPTKPFFVTWFTKEGGYHPP